MTLPTLSDFLYYERVSWLEEVSGIFWQPLEHCSQFIEMSLPVLNFC